MCDDYSVIDGGLIYDDWFLPSLDELTTLYTNLYLYNLGGFVISNNSYYITSSSEYPYDNNYNLGYYFYNYSFGAGNGANQFYKSYDYEVRAMRTF